MHILKASKMLPINYAYGYCTTGKIIDLVLDHIWKQADSVPVFKASRFSTSLVHLCQQEVQAGVLHLPNLHTRIPQ